MAERSEQRRRIAVALVALLGAAATIATSPAPTPMGRLDQSTSGTVVLTDGAPRAVGRFVLTISPEALPVATDTSRGLDGTVSFVAQPASDGGGGGGPLELSVSAVDIAAPAQAEYGGRSWPIGQLCRPAEPCHREFDVALEWLQPQLGGSMAAHVQANVTLTYSQRPDLPTGASAAWQASEIATVAPGPSLTAHADLGSVTLGRESPWAARHVRLRGSAALIDDPGADVNSFLSWEPKGEEFRRPVIVTLVPDDSAIPVPFDAGAIMAPLEGCPSATACVRGFTIIASWAQLGPDDQVDLRWSYGALARFPGATGVPAGADLTVEVDNTIDLGPTSPRLSGQASGSLELQPDGGRRYGELTLGVTAFDLGDAFFGQAPPAIAVVRLRAAVKNPGTPAGLTAGHMVHDAQGEPLQLADDGTEARAVVFPLDHCTGVGLCTGRIEISFNSSTGSEATINWDVTVELAVPRAELAAGRFQVDEIHGP